MKYFIGIDNGGTSTKASVYDEMGREIGTVSMSTKAVYPQNGFVEKDMDLMWQDNCRVIRAVLDKTGLSGTDISAIGACGHGKGLYLLGKDGRPFRNAILSADNRGTELLNELRKKGIEERLFPITLQHMMACQPTVLLLWLSQNEPETLGKIKWILSCKDYIRYMLTGEAGAELTDVSGTGLINLNTADYDSEIMNILGLESLKEALPPIKQSTEVCGFVTPEAAEATGLSEGTPVVGGMFDIDACALSVGALEQDKLCMIAGTWGINEFPYEKPITDGTVAMNSLFCKPGYYLVEESSPTSAGNLERYVENFLPEVKQITGDVYGEINKWAESVPGEKDLPTFVPYLMGGAHNGAARGLLAGLSVSHTRQDITRAIMEGITFSHRHHFEKLAGTGCRFSCIRLSGGAAKSDFWSQMFADVMGLRVEASSINECGTLGVAMAAAVGSGVYGSLEEAAGVMSPEKRVFIPNKELCTSYAKKYAAYERCRAFAEESWN